MRPDFTACAATFANLSQHNSTYNYTGKVYGIFAHSGKPPVITYEGCQTLCGTGVQYYAWKDVSSTIFTWVFPVIGLLLQAPYEGNKNWSTAFALARWIGNPIAGMSYVFWNINVIGKCAMILDMATPYDKVPGPDSQFAQIRDSLYLLSVMNQYTIKPRMPIDHAEKLLRIALFSDSLQLTAALDRTDSLVKKRQKLAKYIRTGRKKGVIAAYVSVGLFVIALAISIQAAFGELGDNQTAHDLALGLLLAWLPVFALSSITDRNPIATDEIRFQFNNLLDLVRTALLDHGQRRSYITTIGKTEHDFAWTKVLENDEYFHNDFFTKFAGQGRVRWHNGCAHSVLSSMEDAWIANCGREWFRDTDGARTRMISEVEPNHHELVWFDRKMFWQIAGSAAILYGTAGGAFILSYFTPTVGLGCRSGGYLNYVTLATAIFAAEMILWWVRATFLQAPECIPEWMKHLPFEDRISQLSERFGRTLDAHGNYQLLHHIRERLRKQRRDWASLCFTDRLGLFITLSEVINCTFLAYIVWAQTVGAYQSCSCMCSVWSSLGGYMDFENYAYYRANGVKYYWGFGTGLSCLVLVAGIAYIVMEYCTQSHLSTENYENAAQGLMTTRRFKKHTMWFRRLARFLAKCANILTFGQFGSNTKTLAWDWMTKDDRIWTTELQVINGRAPTSETLEAGTNTLVKPVAKQHRSFSNDTTLAGSIYQLRTHASSAHKPSIAEE